MNLKDFIKKGQVRRAKKDDSLVKALVKTAKSDIYFFDSIPVTEISARKIISNYYDALRSLLEALAALDGYKIYSHETFTPYLKEKNESPLAEKFDNFRLKGNKINYYGKSITKEKAKETREDILSSINYLLSKYFKELQ